MLNSSPIRGFRAACTAVGTIYILIGASIVARGAAVSMGPYGVPQATLDAPHYVDAILWVYVHMMVLGAVITFMGWRARPRPLQRAFARLMLGAHLVYLYLDLRTSDSAVGNGLYEGAASLGPAVIAGLCTAVFAVLSLAKVAPASQA